MGDASGCESVGGGPSDWDQLTGRGMQVLRRIAHGMGNKQIAAQLGITTKTVEFHVTKLLRKLDARDRFHLADRFDEDMARGN